MGSHHTSIGYEGEIELNLYRGGQVGTDGNGRHYHVPGTGELIATRKKKNVFMQTGQTWAIVRLFDDHGSASVSGTAAHAFYVGTTTSGQAASATSTDTTANTTEIGREAFTYATAATLGRMTGTATFVSATANGAITEAGIFAGATTSGDGVFVARAVFAEVNKEATDTLQIKWTVTIS